ncbi:MAG: hypothetical protein JRD93_16160 [Deltaproteobacteria bacterium]|nr:hypothetical protein [Deltaproteobacteria bacterium]
MIAYCKIVPGINHTKVADLLALRLMGCKSAWAFAGEKFNDDFAKQIAAQLLRSNEAGG